MASNANESMGDYLERIAKLSDPRPCEHIFRGKPDTDLVLCVRCGKPPAEAAD